MCNNSSITCQEMALEFQLAPGMCTLTPRFSHSATQDTSFSRQRSMPQEMNLVSVPPLSTTWTFLECLPFPSGGKKGVWNFCLQSPQAQENQNFCPWRIRLLKRQCWPLGDRGGAAIRPLHLILFMVCLFLTFWDKVLLWSLAILGFIILLPHLP